ncbi:MFS transporter [Atopococcus tabaci]|uniref:MFS transporter n=1 Tax=Atopococcus tabaci TaxID=269774 RepID=UPI000421A269|nr:glycoside-pentoside-hexuronide (GPH):cation symporter [Atopococcus tabaci]
MVFYTEVLGINPNMVGTLFVVARFVDAVSDVVFGKLVDRSKETEAGKFKPWIKRFAGPVALASFLMYQTAMAGAPMTLKVVYMYVTYLLWGSLFYTAINIPYGSMASAISPNPDERTQLSVYRGMAATLGGMFVGTISPLFIYTTDEAGNQIVRGGSAFVIVAGMFSLLSLLFYFICYKWTTERVRVTQTGAEDVSLLQSFAQIFKSRSLLAITGASISLLLVMMMIQQMNNYIFPFYYGSAAGVSLINFINPLVSLLVAFPLASALARRFGKKEVSSIAMFIESAIYALLFFLRPENMYVFMVGVILAFVSVNIFNATVWACITDVIDDHEIQTGHREDGMVYAVNSFARKVGQALAGDAAGWALSWIGYNSGAGGQQAPEVLEGIFNISVLVPATGFLICGLILMFVYPLSRKKTLENQRILSEKE